MILFPNTYTQSSVLQVRRLATLLSNRNRHTKDTKVECLITTAIIIILLSIDDINEDRRADEGELIFGRSIIRKNEMVGVTLSAAFILQS